MTLVNRLLNPIVGMLMAPLQPLGITGSLAVVSLLTAVGVLLIVRATSNQRALADVKRQIHADLFEIRLFNDDLRAIIRAEGDILRHNATYLRHSITPMLWMAVPAALAIAQLQTYYGYAGLEVDRPVLVTAQFTGSTRPATLEAPDAVRVETTAISVPALNQVLWRIVPTVAGDYELQVRMDGESYAKTIHVSEGVARRSPMRVATGLAAEAEYPSEPPLPGGAPISMISVDYPDGGVELFGVTVHWIVMYLVFSMIFALILRRPLRVEI